jgi:hypothetical protein
MESRCSSWPWMHRVFVLAFAGSLASGDPYRQRGRGFVVLSISGERKKTTSFLSIITWSNMWAGPVCSCCWAGDWATNGCDVGLLHGQVRLLFLFHFSISFSFFYFLFSFEFPNHLVWFEYWKYS